MLGLEMLDVAIGVIFVFLLLSLICSAVNELIEAFLKKRAQYLERGLQELLKDMDVGGNDVLKKVYEHPQVAGLYTAKYENIAEKYLMKLIPIRNIPLISAFFQGWLPSYIPSRNFALAFIDSVFPGGVDSANAKNAVQQLKDAINGSGNDRLKKALIPLIDGAGDDINKVRANIETWYNSSMDRISGWYKRRAQVVILILGLIVAVYMNVDTITVVKRLSHDKATRASLVAASQEYAKAEGERLNAAPTPTPNTNETPAECTADAKSTKCVCAEDANSPECKLKTNYDKIQTYGLPIGWHIPKDEIDKFLWLDDSSPYFAEDLGESGTDPSWLLKIFGWLITAAAISLGAPFWFDLLNKFMVVRSTVKPKEKSPEEESKD